MDRPLVSFGIKSHSANQLGASHRTLLDQDATGSNPNCDVKGVVDDRKHGVVCGVDFVILQDRIG